jgi:non-canonical (house-cleaning) NTP pyrophosphatase
MIITLSGSTAYYEAMHEIRLKLEKLGHKVYHPETDNEIYGEAPESEPDRKKYFIDRHIDKIRKSDILLAVNLEKNGVKNYIGTNTLLEIGFAYQYGLPIFLYQELSDNGSKDELVGMGVQTISGNLEQIEEHIRNLSTVYVASGSDIKLLGTRLALRKVGLQANIKGIAVESNISDQPLGYAETETGAINRLKNLRTKVAKENYAYLVSIESGVIELEGKPFDITVCIAEDKNGNTETTISPGWSVPTDIYEKVKNEDEEMGPLYMRMFNLPGKNPIEHETGKKVGREELIEQATAISLAKLLKKYGLEEN